VVEVSTVVRPGSQRPATVWTYSPDGARRRSDRLATEEPLEIRVRAGAERRTVAVTMRTPGADFELASGLLLAEGVVRGRADVARITYCVDRDLSEEQRFNVVNVDLRGTALPDLSSLERTLIASSACGVCGKATLDSLRADGLVPLEGGPVVDARLLSELPARLRAAQEVFAATGGLHAAGLFDPSGELLAVREDVGRHNAVDKLMGWALMSGRIPLTDHLVLVSGRAGYEILQKCLVAGAPVVCSVSAPSSLAVDVARDFGMTLVGFLRRDRFNVYAGAHRIAPKAAPSNGR
jgi:FdhD protein